MEKLNKLQIPEDKLLKNEELMTLRGGDMGLQCYTGKINGPCTGFSCVIVCSDCSYHSATTSGSGTC